MFESIKFGVKLLFGVSECIYSMCQHYLLSIFLCSVAAASKLASNSSKLEYVERKHTEMRERGRIQPTKQCKYRCIATQMQCSERILLSAIGCTDVVHCAFHNLSDGCCKHVRNMFKNKESNMYMKPILLAVARFMFRDDKVVKVSPIKVRATKCTKIRIKINFFRGKLDSRSVIRLRNDTFLIFVQTREFKTFSILFKILFRCDIRRKLTFSNVI